MNDKSKLVCPKCGSSDSLSRIEALYAYAHVTVADGGWDYAGGSEMDYDSQDRDLCRPEDKEFWCHRCHAEFDDRSASAVG